MAKPPSMSRGRGTQHKIKKFEPSDLVTYVLVRPRPRACRGRGIRRADKKMCRAGLKKKIKP
jgi:hypothetical protein